MIVQQGLSCSLSNLLSPQLLVISALCSVPVALPSLGRYKQLSSFGGEDLDYFHSMVSSEFIHCRVHLTSISFKS